MELFYSKNILLKAKDSTFHSLEKMQYYSRNYKSMMSIDKFNYRSLFLLQEFYNNNKEPSEEQSCENNIVEKNGLLVMKILLQQKKFIELIENTEYYHTMQYLLGVFIDNKVNEIFSYDLANQWAKSSIEKTLFQTVTGEYIIKNQIDQIIENNREIPDFALYAYLITMYSFDSCETNFFKERQWLMYNMQRSSLCTPPLIINKATVNYPNNSLISLPKQTKIFYYFLIIFILLLVTFLCKQIYWDKITSILPI